MTHWEFTDERGTFRLNDPHKTSYLYFPLVNPAGMVSSITPTLHGDTKTGHNAYLTPPASVEDLHTNLYARNFWVSLEGQSPWSAAGNSAPQLAAAYEEDAREQVTLEAGMLWHKITRQSRELGLSSEAVNFVPSGPDRVELMCVKLTNTGEQPQTLTPTATIPIFGRSADNLRDHRHVTSLLHRIQCHENGILVRPSLSFDERGHQVNHLTYAVLGAEGQGAPPVGFFPLVETFAGEGGSLLWPEAVVKSLPPSHRPGQDCEGFEAIGALRFREIVLAPGESRTYILVLAVLDEGEDVQSILSAYASQGKFDHWLEQTQAYWQARIGSLSIRTASEHFDRWMKWVSIQPILRRLLGNSFLPYHDYGRGGRGWRDLWQDILALLLMETSDVGDLLFSNFAGVRFDGSNATIIGSQPGEFKADRNDIPRVWMDHGAWPWLTTRLYIDLSGDLDFLLRKQAYFKDHLIHRSAKRDESWVPEQGTILKTASGGAYRGSVLEHILIQNLVPFFNVGAHNNIRLEGADWNDGMDMGAEGGESVAFSSLYAGNLREISECVRSLERLEITEVEVAEELLWLLDTLGTPVDYSSPEAKQARLAAYFEHCAHTVSGRPARIPLQDLSRDLAAKAEWLSGHIRRQEWLQNKNGHGWFNGYYDNHGRRVEGDHPLGVRMTLSGQVFALMGGVASDPQAQEIIRSARHYLFDPGVGGYRLNTDFGEVVLSLGRAFGFAYGHKENGAMFSHMAVMYAKALYQRGFVHDGYLTLEAIYRASVDFPTSRMYPGIPEYFNPNGRGMYPYLTGSASWYLYTLVTECFGIRGALGDFVLSPKLVKQQFDPDGKAAIRTRFADRAFTVTYHNPAGLDYGEYRIGSMLLNGRPTDTGGDGANAIVPRNTIAALSPSEDHEIEITLEKA